MSNSTPVPAVNDFPALYAWLEKHQARYLWCSFCDIAMVQGWRINGQIALILLYTGGSGWDVFTAPSTIVNVETLEDAEQRLGVSQGRKVP